MRAPLLLMALFLAPVLYAQDSLFYANGTVIVGTVLEMGQQTILYRTWSGEHPVQVTAERSEIARVRLASGQDFLLQPRHDQERERGIRARRQAVSIDALAPSLNHITIGYERIIGPRVSLVLKAGYIGAWSTTTERELYNASGALFRGGVKFNLSEEDASSTSLRKRSPLWGWYLRPELAISAWEQREFSEYLLYAYPYQREERRFTIASAALSMIIGGQWLISDRFTFDLHGGFGYGYQWRNGTPTFGEGGDNERRPYAYTHLHLGQYTPLVINGGMMFGYTF